MTLVGGFVKRSWSFYDVREEGPRSGKTGAHRRRRGGGHVIEQVSLL